jgi:hypothetical protein
MASNPGEWYAERREQAERLEAQLAGARSVLAEYERGREAARAIVRRLEHLLEQARYVGD